MFSPIDASQVLQESLLRYIRSSLPLGSRSDQLALGEYFHAHLEKTQFRGPFVEVQPVYSSGPPLSELCVGKLNNFSAAMARAAALRNGDFHGRAAVAFRRIAGVDWENPVTSAWTRPLYQHQQRAFNLILNRQSCVVATGTGSGKTECYLYPLLALLTSEPPQERAKPGVRAILLFPMNALVEDQMRRLRGMLLPLNAASVGIISRPITFGRYTGQTPKDDADKDRPRPEQHIHELGEQLTRAEMFCAPPDILVTNFSMLEYALLRPADHALFGAPGRFRSLVLDEAHTYSGTIGAEVSMLLRRLRTTLAPSEEPVFVGTSATLGSRPEHMDAMAEFASQLFSQPIPRDRVITAPRATPPVPVAVPGLLDEAHGIAALGSGLLMRLVGGHADVDAEQPGWPGRLAGDLRQLALHTGAAWEGMEADIADVEGWSRDPEANARRLLGKVFQAGHAFQRLAAIAAGGGARELRSLAGDLFSTGGNPPAAHLIRATEVLLAAAANAQVGGRAGLAARYHFFIGEQGDAYLCINPDCPRRDSGGDGWWSQLFLSHHARCPSCKGLVFGLRLCRKCGFALLEGWRPQNGAVILHEAGPDQKATRILFRPAPAVSSFEGAKVRRLCVGTGSWFAASDEGCRAENRHRDGCPASVITIAEWSSDAGDAKLERCPECDQGWYQGEEVFTAPSISPYAAGSVLLEETARCLRGAHLRSQILSFSDSRQQAAKLAARLQRTNRDYAFRQVVWRVVLEAKETLNSRTLLDRIFDRVGQDDRLVRLFATDPTDKGDAALRSSLGELLFREAAAPYRSLESIGAVTVAYAEALQETARLLRVPAGLQGADGLRRNVLRAILDLGFRYRACMGAANNAIPFSDPNLQRWKLYRSVIPARAVARDPANMTALFLKQFTRRNVLLNLVNRCCAREGISLSLAEFNDLIDSFWEAVFAQPALLTSGESRQERDRALIRTGGAPESSCLQLNLNSLLWGLPDANSLFQCGACRRITPINALMVCPARDCEGTLEPIRPEDLDSASSSVSHYRKLVERDPTPLRVEEHTAEISPRRRGEIERDFRNDGGDAVDVISGSTTFELGIDIGTINAVYMANLPPRLANYRQRAGRAGRAGGISPLIVSYVRQRPHDQYFWRDIAGFITGPVPPPKFKLSSREILRRHGFSLLVAAALRRYDESGAPKGGLWGPKWSDFSGLMGNGPEAWGQAITDCAKSMKSIFAGVDPGLESELRPPKIATELCERLRRAQPLLDQRAEDGLIEVLSDYGILPSYSFPIYVDEMRLFKCQPRERPRRDLTLTRDRRISLNEYYPGRVITAGGYQIKSLGLWEGWEDRALCHCPSCGRITGKNSTQRCRCATKPVEVNAIVPWGGFYGETVLDESPPELDREASAASETEFDPAGDPPPPDVAEGAALILAFYDANLMKLARMRQFSPRLGSDVLRLRARKHHDVGWHWVTHKCLQIAAPDDSQAASSYHLLHEFTTDAIRLRFRDHPAARPLLARDGSELARAWATLGEAILVAAARFLDIDDVANAELGITWRPCDDALGGRDLVIYDTAAGGAGYARAIGENLREVFDLARVIVSGCDCGDSCYRCLRSYRNQHLHARLDRALVNDGLADFVKANWPPLRRQSVGAGR